MQLTETLEYLGRLSQKTWIESKGATSWARSELLEIHELTRNKEKPAHWVPRHIASKCTQFFAQTLKSLCKIRKKSMWKERGDKSSLQWDFFCPQGHTLPGGVYLLHNTYTHAWRSNSQEKNTIKLIKLLWQVIIYLINYSMPWSSQLPWTSKCRELHNTEQLLASWGIPDVASAHRRKYISMSAQYFK